jgi:oxygen-independent coproporphyrinogen-3 oxidase
MDNSLLALLNKYDVPTPRYTSYPTVPFWDFSTLNTEAWKKSVVDTYIRENGELSIYIHLPYCEQLCTFCACNKRISKNHAVEEPYIETVLREWTIYRNLLPGTPVIREIHLGGGTPTFFSPERLRKLIKGILATCTIAPEHEFSVEVHPNYTKEAHLEALAEVGFNRISLGIQDFDPNVQYVINRIQTFEKTKEVVDWARALGYNSVNFDLIYGLPRQSVQSIEMTIDLVKKMRPDRIAFYSYAHVPWKSKVQRRYTDEDLPKAADKWKMYHRGNELLAEMGMVSIGMDHFALPNDKLMTAYVKGEMHRNFMGYTTTNNKLIIGLGASSISDSWSAFAQNEKEVEEYQDRVIAGELPLMNGHLLNEEDEIIRRHILDLMCQSTTTLNPKTLPLHMVDTALQKLETLVSDGLVEVSGTTITATPKGKLFIRNISASLDAYLWRKNPEVQLFSKAI